MGIVTGALAYHKFGFQSDMATEQATRPLVCGLEEKISNLIRTDNQEALSALNQITRRLHYYGKAEGSYSIAWKLSSSAAFRLLFGAVQAAVAGQAALSQYTFTKQKIINHISHELGVDTDTDHVRVAIGAVCDELTISSSVGELVDCNASMKYAKEADVSDAVGTAVYDPIEFPYTFIHGEIKIPASDTVMEVQSVDLSISQPKTFLHGHGSKFGTSAYQGVLEMAGSLTKPLVDNDFYNKVVGREEVANMKLIFDSGRTGADQDKIEITGTGVGFKTHTIPSIEPNEPIFEQVDFDWREINIVAIHKTIAGLV